MLNVSWQMEGVDINVDINIGRHLSALANTLTTFTDVDGEEEEDPAAIGISEIDGPSSAQVFGVGGPLAARGGLLV